MKKDDMLALSETVRAGTWEDAKNTANSPSLVGPPSLELSAYKKVPGNKKRTDARQGTIDQDPEFMAFLEGLANPVPMRENIDIEDGDEASKSDAKPTTTPLVEYLKEKKANKSKDSGPGKKRGDGKSKGSKDEDSSKKRGRESKAEKSEKAEKGSKTTVKILTKKAATEQAADAAKNAAKAINAAIQQEAPKSRRAGIATAARILQRDLGLSPGSAHRRARQDAAKAEASAKAKDGTQADPTQDTPQAAETTSSPDGKSKAGAKSQSGRKGRDGKNGDKNKTGENAPSQTTAANPPVILKKKPEGQVASSPVATSTPATTTNQQNGAAKLAQAEKNAKAPASNNKGAQSQKKSQPVSPGATKAFVKHAVHSQGVTEAALRLALEPLGTVAAIEMDKRKGFAYVDFSDHEGLVKAVAASPLSVAQGSVQILERKDKKPAAQPGSGAGSSTATAPTDKEKIKEGEKEKEKPAETRRGRRGRGGKGNNNGGAANAQAGTASVAQAAVSAPIAAPPASSNDS